MTQDVPLVEGNGATGTVDPERDVATVQAQPQDRRRRGSVNFSAGGRDGDPVLEIPTSGGSIELGYEDIFLMLVALDLGVRLAKLLMEVSN